MGWIQHYLLKILNFTRENWVSVHRNGGYIIVILVGDSCYPAITISEKRFTKEGKEKNNERNKEMKKQKEF